MLAVANAATDMTNQRTTKKQSTIEISILNYPLDQIRLHPRAEAKGNATSGSRADHVDSATSASSSTPTGLRLRPRARSSSDQGRDRRAEQRKGPTQVLQLPQLLCENYSLYAGIRVTHLDSRSPAPRSTVRLRVVRATACVAAARQVKTLKDHARPWRFVLRVSLSQPVRDRYTVAVRPSRAWTLRTGKLTPACPQPLEDAYGQSALTHTLRP